MSTRGFRNNNPGNIDYNAGIKWKGQVGIETGVPNPRFVQFDSMASGVRALCKLLQTYAKKYKLDTIEKIVTRYAPSHENKTDKYIENVSKWSGFKPTDKINPFSVQDLTKIVPAIIRQENGISADSREVAEGIKQAVV